MRPIFVRVLTGALVITGIAGAITLPRLTVGEATSPPHVFAIPALADEVVIMSDHRTKGTKARPVRLVPRPTAPAPTPSRAVVAVVTPPTRRSVPVAAPRPAVAVPKPSPLPKARPRPAPVPTPAAPAPAPAPAPTPAPGPAATPATPAAPAAEPVVVRAVMSDAPESEDEKCKRKHDRRKDGCHGSKDDDDRDEYDDGNNERLEAERDGGLRPGDDSGNDYRRDDDHHDDNDHYDND